uniref:V-type proton ATPase subunit C n=1 Tax=Aegilops tauschii subsp. strangulata TaxID=200361 RepID=A0A453T8Z5_AEGTS
CAAAPTASPPSPVGRVRSQSTAPTAPPGRHLPPLLRHPALPLHCPGSPTRHARLPACPQRRPRQVQHLHRGRLAQDPPADRGPGARRKGRARHPHRDGVPVDSYLTRFVWDEGKYPVNAPLKETVASIQSQVAKIEDLVNTIVLSIMDILFHC